MQVCCIALQRVAVRCSALQCVAVCCSAMQRVAVHSSVLQCVAVCCSVLQSGVVKFVVGYSWGLVESSCCDVVCYSVLQCVAACCIVLQLNSSPAIHVALTNLCAVLHCVACVVVKFVAGYLWGLDESVCCVAAYCSVLQRGAMCYSVV